MAKLLQNRQWFFVTIPKPYVRWKKWKRGQELIIIADQDNNLVIKEADLEKEREVKG